MCPSVPGRCKSPLKFVGHVRTLEKRITIAAKFPPALGHTAWPKRCARVSLDRTDASRLELVFGSDRPAGFISKQPRLQTGVPLNARAWSACGPPQLSWPPDGKQGITKQGSSPCRGLHFSCLTFRLIFYFCCRILADPGIVRDGSGTSVLGPRGPFRGPGRGF